MKLTRLIAIGILATAGTALAQESDLTPDSDRVVVQPPPPAAAPGIGDPVAPRAITPADDNDFAASGFVDRDGDGLDDRYEADKGRSDRPKYEPPSKMGMAVVLGGGVTDFITDRASQSVQVGPEWAARLNLGTRSFIGAEAAYTGTTQTLSTLGGGQSALMSHGVQTLARANFTKDRLIQPYVAAGIGYRRYNLINSNETATSDVQDGANVAEIPAATGIALRAKGFIFDGRFNVGVPISTPALRNMNNRVDATTWGVNGNVGFEF